MVLTSGELAGVNLRAWFILIRRRKIFHGMEREFRFKVICTQGKSQNHSHDYDDLSFNNFQEQTGLPAQCKVLMAGLFPSKTSIHILTFTVTTYLEQGGIRTSEVTDSPHHPPNFLQPMS